MKRLLELKFAFALPFILFLLNSCGKTERIHQTPEFNRWHMPQNVKFRLGKGSVNDLTYSPDGSRLAVASSIGIWLYDAYTGEESALLTRHTHGVHSIAFSPDGRLAFVRREVETTQATGTR